MTCVLCVVLYCYCICTSSCVLDYIVVMSCVLFNIGLRISIDS